MLVLYYCAVLKFSFLYAMMGFLGAALALLAISVCVVLCRNKCIDNSWWDSGSILYVEVKNNKLQLLLSTGFIT